MSRRERKVEFVVSGGSSSGLDGLYSIGGGGTGIGSPAETQGSGFGTGGANGRDERGVNEAPWFAPITDFDSEYINSEVEFGVCKGGVCPVPWATSDTEDDNNYLTTAKIPDIASFIADAPIFTIENRPKVQEDTVNHPSHYTDGGIECIEAIEAALSDEEFRGYCKGNCVKYIWRERFKGGTESLKKAQWYLTRLIEMDESQNG